MGELKKSFFQMRGFHIQSIHFSASTSELTPDDYSSILVASKNTEYKEEISAWVGLILLNLKLVPNENQQNAEQPSMYFDFTAATTFSMEAANDDQSKKQFEDLLKLNGMVSTLSAARTNVIQLSMQLGISPPIIVPNVDLRKFEWVDSEQ